MNSTNGVFWLNSAETWVDITTSSESKTNSNVMEKIVNLVAGSSSSQANSGCNAYFMSETGIVDVFFMLGPGPYDVTRQYSRLTGTAPLPPVSNQNSNSFFSFAGEKVLFFELIPRTDRLFLVRNHS